MTSFTLLTVLVIPTLLFSHTLAFNSSSSSILNTTNHDTAALHSLCRSTPFPDVCFDSLKLSISITIGPDILTFIYHTLQAAITDSTKLSNLLFHVTPSDIVEHKQGAVQDCQELHQITISSLQKSMSRIRANKLSDANSYLSAALTNKNTCLEGLDTATGPLKPTLVNSFLDTYKSIGNSLSLLSKSAKPNGRRRRLLGFPAWLVGKRRRRVLQEVEVGVGDEYDPNEVITVAGDGTGNFTTINDAINFAPNNSYNDRVTIYIREGVYEENVEIPSYKTNIVLVGDGKDVTVITGSRSMGSDWTTFRSATVAVSAEGFLARDITFENTAGPENHQAVALRINADFSAVYRCAIVGYQDTLYAHSFRQFYRECDIYGTIDYVFGNAAAVFQACNLISRLPLPGQFNAITAHARDLPDEDTGFSMQNCSVLGADELYASNTVVKSYLGRPWRIYSRTVYIESFIDDFIDPAGWKEWSGSDGLDTLYYGEYNNNGPGAGTDSRVTWPGYHIMDYDEASNFTVSRFIVGDEWLQSTSFPYDDGV